MTDGPAVRAILTYHSIDDSGSPVSVPASAFARHVAWLRSGRVQVVSVADLLALPPDIDAVALTFDDGFCNFATEAAPRLSGLPVTLFVVTDHVGRTNNWADRAAPGIPTLPLLDWPALARLREAGVTLGAHTRRHPDLTTLPSAALKDEIDGSAERLRSETGVGPDAFAYPYGSVSPTVIAAAARRFRLACTTELRCLGPDVRPAELPRLDMYYFRRSGRLESWGSSAFQRYLAWRALLRRGRRIGESALSQASASSRDTRPT